MKVIIALCTTFLLISMSFFSVAEEENLFEEGIVAYEAGDYEKAKDLLIILAEQDHSGSQFIIATMYNTGKGVKKDIDTAIRWYIQASNNGNASAAYMLASKYRYGDGVIQDYEQALKFYTIASSKKDVPSMDALASMYEFGLGVNQDPVKAHMWYNIAASKGSILGKEFRNIISKNMTKEQIDEAQKLARECVAKDYKGC